MVCRNVDKLQKQKVNFLDKNEASLKKKDKKQTMLLHVNVNDNKICKKLRNILLLLFVFLFSREEKFAIQFGNEMFAA